MAGWSLSTAAPADSLVEILLKLQSIGFCSDLDASDKEQLVGEKLSSLFDQILSAFFMEIYKRGNTRPLPAMLGDGQSVDLFKLYSTVQGKGGFDSVTDRCAWASVAEDIGLDAGVGSSLKLIFFKYLDVLDQWLQRLSGKKVAGQRLGYKILQPLVLQGCHRWTGDQDQNYYHSTPLSSSKKDQFLTPFGGSGRRLQFGNSGSCNGDCVEILETDVDYRSSSFNCHNNKRKREDLVGMLNWVRKMAMDPAAHSFVKVLSPNKGKSKYHGTSELYSIALLARQAMFLKRTRRTSPDLSHLEKGQKIHPCVNGTGSNSRAKEINCNQRLQYVTQESALGTCSETSTVANLIGKDKALMSGGGESSDVKQRHRNSRLNSKGIASWLSDQQQVRIPVGPYFQAKFLSWSGQPSPSSIDSDALKWLGTRTWPPENQKAKPLLAYGAIGRGRPDNCRCERPGSVECIRFHTAEKRLHLRREISTAFNIWGFERMGEEVSLSWTEEEERKFRAIVHLNRPSLNKNFWHQLHLYFPYKGSKSLVSYYFNVFLLGQRRYQNRVTPNNIDSDDEETEFGFLSNPFGHDAVKICDTKSIVCAQNAQCVEFGD